MKADYSTSHHAVLNKWPHCYVPENKVRDIWKRERNKLEMLRIIIIIFLKGVNVI